MNRKLSVTILFSIILIVSVIYYFYVLRPQQQYYYAHYVKIHGVYLLKSIDINHFSLMDTHAKEFTKENLKGHWTMIYFGFTHCDMVCPATMDVLNKMYTMLQNKLTEKNLPQVVLITIDPERDTLKRLNDFVTAFNAHFIGVRGSVGATSALLEQLHVTATKTHEGDNVTLDHSADIVLVNPEAKIQAYFPYPHKPEDLVEDYRSILAKMADNR